MGNENETPTEIREFATIESGYVQLPFGPEEFRDFVMSLLGSAQVVSKRFEGCFEIDHHSISQVHHLLDQRVRQQNGAALLSFRAKVVYSGGTSVEHTTLESILSYQEIKPTHVVKLFLSWDFLIQFLDRNHPEKQRIQIEFSTEDNSNSLRSLRFQHESRAAITFRIEHTARTWASDIDALLTDQFGQYIKPVSRLKRALHSPVFSDASLMAIGLFFTGAVLTIPARHARAYTIKNLENILGDPHQAVTAIEKVDQLIQLLVLQQNFDRDFGPIASVFITAAIVSILVNFGIHHLRAVRPSFILLSSYSQKHKTESLLKYNRGTIRYILSFIVAILAGIIGNVLVIKLVYGGQ